MGLRAFTRQILTQATTLDAVYRQLSSVEEIATRVDATPRSVSWWLKKAEANGLVESRRVPGSARKRWRLCE